MKFSQELQDEDVRFKKTEEDNRKLHRQVHENAKKELADIVRAFAQDHYVGEWIGDYHNKERVEHRRPMTGWAPHWEINHWIGRYFTTSGEATNFYIIGTRTYSKVPINNGLGYFDNDEVHYVGLCFEEKSHQSLEKIIQLVKSGNRAHNICSSQIMDSEVEGTLFNFGHGQICEINIEELGINKNEYERLLGQLMKDKDGRITR